MVKRRSEQLLTTAAPGFYRNKRPKVETMVVNPDLRERLAAGAFREAE